MPRGDGTGPMGLGAFCFGRGIGTGYRMGAGMGRRMGFSYSAPQSPQALDAQAEIFEQQAVALRKLAEQDRQSK